MNSGITRADSASAGSREQNFRPEDCGICHAVLVGKRGHGFWEGGKGTRDRARMSRKGTIPISGIDTEGQR